MGSPLPSVAVPSALLCFSYVGAATPQTGYMEKISITHSYALACGDVHEDPQERQERLGTKTKKSRNCLRDLDLPYFMRNILTDGAEGGIRDTVAPLFSSSYGKT